MISSHYKNAEAELLACLVDEDDIENSYFRILSGRNQVKYISTAPKTFLGFEDDRTFAPILLHELFPQLPGGFWNKGHLARSLETGEPIVHSTELVNLPGVTNCWHCVKLDELDFTRRNRVRQRVHVSTHPELNDGKPVLVKLAVWPWEVPFAESETTAYQWIKGSGIGPKFLGHLTEGKDGRVIGFVAEWLEGARAARPEDFDVCKKALSRLHNFGIKLGDVNKHNFLVRDGFDVVLVDFELAKRDCSLSELAEEMNALWANLQDPSPIGGVEQVPPE